MEVTRRGFLQLLVAAPLAAVAAPRELRAWHWPHGDAIRGQAFDLVAWDEGADVDAAIAAVFKYAEGDLRWFVHEVLELDASNWQLQLLAEADRVRTAHRGTSLREVFQPRESA